MGKARKEVLPVDIIGCTDDRECTMLNHEGIKMISPSGKAALLVIDGEERWIPLSQIMDASDDSLTITLWFAEKEGLA